MFSALALDHGLRTKYTHMLSALASVHGFKNEVCSCV